MHIWIIKEKEKKRLWFYRFTNQRNRKGLSVRSFLRQMPKETGGHGARVRNMPVQSVV
jgi:hypothetical protein